MSASLTCKFYFVIIAREEPTGAWYVHPSSLASVVEADNKGGCDVLSSGGYVVRKWEIGEGTRDLRVKLDVEKKQEIKDKENHTKNMKCSLPKKKGARGGRFIRVETVHPPGQQNQLALGT